MSGAAEAVRLAIAVPLELDTAQGRISLIFTTTVFSKPTEVTLSELAIEAFYPADPASAERMRVLQGAAAGQTESRPRRRGLPRLATLIMHGRPRVDTYLGAA